MCCLSPCVCVPAMGCCLVYEVARRVAVCLGAREGSGGKCTATVREQGCILMRMREIRAREGVRSGERKGNTRTVEAKGVSEVKVEKDGWSRPQAAASSYGVALRETGDFRERKIAPLPPSSHYYIKA